MSNDPIALAIVERIITSGRVADVMKPRLKLIAKMNFVEANLKILTYRELSDTFTNASDLIQKLVEIATTLEHTELIFCHLTDTQANPGGLDLLEQIFFIFGSFEASSCYSFDDDAQNDENGDDTSKKQASIDILQFQSCLTVIHAF
ncbi:hypothetical protein HK100_012276, partial [Physocladia obscura]